MKILTIDDSTVVTNMVRFSLEKVGIECEVAAHGLAGITCIKQEDPPFDFILSDLNMPYMDGMEMLRQIRKDFPNYNDIPFVFLSTTSDQEIKEEAKALGARAWMKKPFTPEVLLEMIRRFSGWEG